MAKRSRRENADMLNSRLYRGMELFIGLLLLNLLWLVCCLPVVTAPPSTAAMFGVVRGWINNTDDEIVMPFFRHFKANFGQSLWLGFLWLVVACVLVLDFVVIGYMDSWVKVLLFVFVGVGTLCFAITSVYLFPVMVNYDANWRIVLRNSFLIALAQPGPTVLCVLVVALALVIVYIVPPVVLLAGSGTAYVLYLLCRRAFGRIEGLKGMKLETDNESESV